jgi:ribosomal protein S18 acetylase RimI-like enzyme
VLDEAYELRDGPPPATEAVEVRRRSGLTPKTLEQTVPALEGSWSVAHVVLRETGALVGMGRVIGDGGWYFHITDMCVDPDHQRRGIGNAVLTRLIDGIRAATPADPYITLLADPPGRALYRRHGFVETAPDSLGMVQQR